MTQIAFEKAHGTGNDFIVIADIDGELVLDEAQVKKMCDRHFGLGADGILRIVLQADGLYLMDYRNSDGSLALMCGNGARVFAAYLYKENLVDSKNFEFRTRSGVVKATIHDANSVTVSMPKVEILGKELSISHAGKSYRAQAVTAPNPHAVVIVDDLTSVGDLKTAPTLETTGVFEDGVNVEFVEKISNKEVKIKVHERGSGETLSCGTGACAVAAVLHEQTSENQILVNVAGGLLQIDFKDDEILMTGPVEFVASGVLNI
jgi:diaminopimelate epimerase